MRQAFLSFCVAVLAVAALSTAQGAEQNPRQVLVLDLKHPDQKVLDQIVERVQAAAYHTAKVPGRGKKLQRAQK